MSFLEDGQDGRDVHTPRYDDDIYRGATPLLGVLWIFGFFLAMRGGGWWEID